MARWRYGWLLVADQGFHGPGVVAVWLAGGHGPESKGPGVVVVWLAGSWLVLTDKGPTALAWWRNCWLVVADRGSHGPNRVVVTD